MNRSAIYPGTFDPITCGHEDILRRACTLFDEVLLAVAVAHHKKTLFTLDERLEMAQGCARQWPQVRVLPYDGLLVDFARQQGARAIVRGLRSESDFDFEARLAGMNAALAPEVETVFLNAGGRWQAVSSTHVREIALLGGDVSPFVPAHVWQRLLHKREALRTA